MAAKKKKSSKKGVKKGTKSSAKSEKKVKKTVSKKKVITEKKKDPKHIFLILACLVLALTTYFVYAGALDNEFVDWDDYAYVIDNNLIRADSDISQVRTLNTEPGAYTTTTGDVFKRIVSLNYHPLTILTMRWNNNVCSECMNGISAEPFIRWNIYLHILNSILVLLLIYWMSRKNLLA